LIQRYHVIGDSFVSKLYCNDVQFFIKNKWLPVMFISDSSLGS